MSDVKSASLFGLTTAEVQRAKVLMSNGTSHELELKSAKVGAGEFKAFGYRIKKAELKRGIGPTAVIAIDANGAEIDRQTTGIGG